MFDHVIPLLANELANDLVRAIEGMTGETAALSLGEMRSAPRDTFLTWRQRFNASRGSAWLSADAGVWAEIGSRTLRAAGIEEHDPPTAKATFAEILGQAFSMLARSISGRLAMEWTCTEGAEASGFPTQMRWVEAELRFPDGYAAQLLVAFEDALLRAVDSPRLGTDRPPGTVDTARETDDTAIPEREIAVVSPGGAPGPAAAEPLPRSKTLELLLDVELPVSVSFGRAQLPLKEVVKLTTGSIIELNRTIMEPVEVIVNNCVIARGEVVVVEGNFGVRIQQVVSREERLRTLF